MSHPEQLRFVEQIKAAFPSYFNTARVLEIGSLDINGTVRKLFSSCDYIGLDVGAGPGVDVVCQGQEYDGPDSSFDTVISCEVMEHNPYWSKTMTNMVRMTKPGGLVVMTCASTARREHGTTRTSAQDSPLSVGIGWEYYKNLAAADFRSALPLGSLFSSHLFLSHYVSKDLYFFGFKAGAEPPVVTDQIKSALKAYYAKSNRAHLLGSDYIKMRLLMKLFGEDRYWAGPIRLWA